MTKTRLLSLTILMAISVHAAAGAEGGPREMRGVVAGGGSTAHVATFLRDQPASAIVRVPESADVVTVVFDDRGELVTSAGSAGGYCRVSWSPKKTGRYRIEIHNRAPRTVPIVVVLD